MSRDYFGILLTAQTHTVLSGGVHKLETVYDDHTDMLFHPHPSAYGAKTRDVDIVRAIEIQRGFPYFIDTAVELVTLLF